MHNEVDISRLEEADFHDLKGAALWIRDARTLENDRPAYLKLRPETSKSDALSMIVHYLIQLVPDRFRTSMYIVEDLILDIISKKYNPDGSKKSFGIIKKISIGLKAVSGILKIIKLLRGKK